MNSDRDFRDILTELKNELLQSAHTRFELFKQEMTERLAVVKIAAPLVAAGAVLLGTGFLLLTAAIVVLIAAAFPANIYRWFFGTIIVGVLWMLAGSASVYMVILRVKAQPMLPVKTLEVLREDKSRLEKVVHEHAEPGTPSDRAA